MLLDLGTMQELGMGGQDFLLELQHQKVHKLEVVWQHLKSHGKNHQMQTVHTSKCKQSTPISAKSKQCQ
jgi:hypothetical protein